MKRAQCPTSKTPKHEGEKMKLSEMSKTTLWAEAQTEIDTLDEEMIDEIYDIARSIVDYEGWNADYVEAEYGDGPLAIVLLRYCFEAEEEKRARREAFRQNLIAQAKHLARLENQRIADERSRRR